MLSLHGGIRGRQSLLWGEKQDTQHKKSTDVRRVVQNRIRRANNTDIANTLLFGSLTTEILKIIKGIQKERGMDKSGDMRIKKSFRGNVW